MTETSQSVAEELRDIFVNNSALTNRRPSIFFSQIKGRHSLGTKWVITEKIIGIPTKTHPLKKQIDRVVTETIGDGKTFQELIQQFNRTIGRNNPLRGAAGMLTDLVDSRVDSRERAMMQRREVLFATVRNLVPFDLIEVSTNSSKRLLVSDPAITINLMELTESEFHRKVNEMEFKKLLRNKNSLLRQLAKTVAGATRQAISLQLTAIDPIEILFAKWFLKYGYEVPGLESAGVEELGESEKRRVRVIYRRAKYLENHFREVDELVAKKHFKQNAALDEVCSRYDFNREGFEKQYRIRHLNKKKALKTPIRQ